MEEDGALGEWETHFGMARTLGASVHEYRIYFGKDCDRLVILVGGGTTNNEKGQEGSYNGFDKRFQGNNPGARKTRSWLSQGASPRGNRKLSLG
jgi:hypothetical protein